MTTENESGLNPIHALFNHAGMRAFWCKIRYVVATALLLLLAWLFWRFPIQPKWFWIGFGVSMFGEFIQLWCFAALKKEKVLACRGPYVLVRNPMYLGRFFIILGIILLFGKPALWAVIPYAVGYWFYMVNRVRREEAKLIGIFGEPYEAYCRDVNRFLPSMRGGHLGDIWFWKWEWLTGNHGWLNLAALLGVYVVFYVVTFLIR